MKKVTKGNVTIKLWDIGGQERFRTMWERYCRGVNAILYFINFSRYLFHFFSTSIQNDYHLSAFTDEYCSSLIFFKVCCRCCWSGKVREGFRRALGVVVKASSGWNSVARCWKQGRLGRCCQTRRNHWSFVFFFSFFFCGLDKYFKWVSFFNASPTQVFEDIHQQRSLLLQHLC